MFVNAMYHSKYLIRCDDISPFMNMEKFNRILDLCLSYNIKPLLGIIPDNRDPLLTKESKPDESIWSVLLELWSGTEIDISLHGYQHLNHTHEAGIMKLNNRSEFAGLPYATQLEKIQRGLSLLEDKGFSPVDTFMAPSHSFDSVTLKALSFSGVRYLTDGFGMFPFISNDITFLPQQLWTPRKFIFGFWTICLHTDLMENEDFNVLKKFLACNYSDFISFQKYKQIANRYDQNFYQLINSSFNIFYRSLRQIRRYKKTFSIFSPSCRSKQKR